MSNSSFIQAVHEKQAYPFIKCLHPKFVRNPYTGELVQTSCGICSACIKSRNDKMSFQCSIEEQDHEYCMFVTLTYSNVNVPLSEPVIEHDDTGDVCVFYNRCERLSKYYNDCDIIAVDSCSSYRSGSKFLVPLLSKIGLGRYVPYASKIDLQLFLKRFRKRIFKKSYEKIRYYAVAEYGPVHFRPHFHLLFFFDSEVTFSSFGKALRESWTYGRVDFSLSRGKCSSYVSGYVNSTCSLPRFYSLGLFRPFSTHSNFFAKGFYKNKASEIYEMPVRDFLYECRQVGSKFVEFMPWRSLTALFFPRCRKYDSKSYGELYQSYTILRRCRQVYGDFKVSELVELILNSDETPLNSAILRYFSDYDSLTAKYMLRTSGSISSELYCSKRFLDFCCDGRDEHYVLRKIINFYKERDYINLTSQYLIQQAYFEQWKFSDKDTDWWKYFYVNALPFYTYYDRIRTLQVYKSFYTNSEYLLSESVKHKHLNDLNNIFNQNL